jgi:hypothetical protein
MPRRLLPLVLLLPLAPAALLLSRSSHADTRTLVGTVGTNDAFVISLTDGGNAVANLDPGTWDVLVHDGSAIHNFHLIGPGVNVATDVSSVGDQTFTVTFQAGSTYDYLCDPHSAQMHGSFTTAAAPQPTPTPTPTSEPTPSPTPTPTPEPTPTPSPTPTPTPTATPTPTPSPSPTPTPPPRRRPARRLSASVGPRGAAKLPASVVAGRYKLIVTDRSRRDNFHLVGKGVNKRTGLRFTGTVMWPVKLERGIYRYGSDRLGLTHRLRVRKAPASRNASRAAE